MNGELDPRIVEAREALRRAIEDYNRNEDWIGDRTACVQDFHQRIHDHTQLIQDEEIREAADGVRRLADYIYNAAMGGERLDTTNIVSRAEATHIEGLDSWASSLESCASGLVAALGRRGELDRARRQARSDLQHVYNEVLEGDISPDEDTGVAPEQDTGVMPEGDTGAASEEDTDAALVDTVSGRCGAPCTGHGREGEPCRRKLGERRTCCYHGYRPSQTQIA